MDKISLYLLNRLKFIGNYEFESRNNKLYINGYELEKIKDYKNKLHSIKVITYSDVFDYFEIDELLDLTIKPKLLRILYNCFKLFFDSGYSSDFMNRNYESRNSLKNKVYKLIDDINTGYEVRLITTGSLISFVVPDKKHFNDDAIITLFDHLFSINLIKINHDWRIEINFRESVLNPNYLDLISKIKGRKISDIYLDIYPIEKRDNKLFINNQKFYKIVNFHTGDYSQLYTYYKSKDFSSEELYKYEDLLYNDYFALDFLSFMNRFIKSQLIEKINKHNWIELVSQWLFKNDYKFKSCQNYIILEINYIYYEIKLIVDSKFLNLFKIKFNRTGNSYNSTWYIHVQFEKINNENFIELYIGYDHIRKEWKNKISRVRTKFPEIKVLNYICQLKEKLPSDVPIGSTSISTNVYGIFYSSENYKDLITKFDKFIDLKISYIFIDGVDKLFEIFINKFRMILGIDQMEEVLSNKNPRDSDINKRMKIISDYLSKINFDHELIKGDKYNEIKIQVDPNNDIDIITLKQDDSNDHICLLFELEIYINKFNFRIEFKYFENSYKINIKFDGRFISKFIKK